MKTIIIDAGHGGMLDGEYQIIEKGSKQFHFPNFSVYEGDINRHIAMYLEKLLTFKKIPYISIYHPFEDTSLTKRVNELKRLKKKGVDGYLISIHNNAGKGTGTEVYSTRKVNDSDKMANIYVEEHVEAFGSEIRMRGHKETDYKIIRDSPFYGILVEGLFMDTLEDAKKMVSPSWQKSYAEVLLKVCERIISEL